MSATGRKRTFSIKLKVRVVVQNPLKANLQIVDALLADPVPPIRCTPSHMQFARQAELREFGPTYCAMVMIVADRGWSPFATCQRDADEVIRLIGEPAVILLGHAFPLEKCPRGVESGLCANRLGLGLPPGQERRNRYECKVRGRRGQHTQPKSGQDTPGHRRNESANPPSAIAT